MTDASGNANHAELLSIAIPTRNRARYLHDVLAAFDEQIRRLDLSTETVRIYVSDNTSTDNTPELVNGFATRLPHMVSFRNPENIGGDRNFLQCIRLARGRFCWLVGDDDIINADALERVVQTLQNVDLALMINLDTNYQAVLKRPCQFASFRDFATECARLNPHLLAEHSLITSNIFRTEVFDQALAEATMSTSYAHMYGLASGLIKKGGAVYLPDFPVVTVRARRAPAVDGVWPGNLEKAWVDYLNWLKKEADLPELRPEAVVEHVRNALWQKIKKNPFKYVWNNLPALKQPQAYRWFLKRVLFMMRLKKD
jgi:glycosyltransferase involved in cell wall biosynthesis